MASATERNETRNVSESDERKARAFEMLLDGTRPAEVARTLGIDRTTLWRWRGEPDFAARYRCSLDERAKDVAVRLDAVAGAALELLEDVLSDEKQHSAIRVRAASEILKHAALVRVPPTPAEVEADRDARLLSLLEHPPEDLCRVIARAWPLFYPAMLRHMEETNDAPKT
jgi:hypothetical protein